MCQLSPCPEVLHHPGRGPVQARRQGDRGQAVGGAVLVQEPRELDFLGVEATGAGVTIRECRGGGRNKRQPRHEQPGQQQQITMGQGDVLPG